MSSSRWSRLKEHRDNAERVQMIGKPEGGSPEEKENRLAIVQRNHGASRVSFAV